MGLPSKIVMASSNAGKLREIRRILADFSGPVAVSIVAQSEYGVGDADETGTSFAENALIKARHASDETGLPAIADDSGLVVDALDGRPGIYSARYSGADATSGKNIEKLLREMREVPDEARGAAFYCAACFVAPGEAEPMIAEASWRGKILRQARGQGGFGYDPVFFDVASGRSAAELSADEKNARSHRGKALRSLARKLERRFG